MSAGFCDGSFAPQIHKGRRSASAIATSFAVVRNGIASCKSAVSLKDVLIAITSSGLTAGVLQFLNAWVNARNGRKLKIRVGDIEVDATQLKEEEVLRIFELLENKADRRKTRDLRITTNQERASESR
jgi:hypothetical protein